MMAIVVVTGLCALSVGCGSSNMAQVAPGSQVVDYKHRSVAEKFADFAKQGWTVSSKELDAKRAKAIPGTNGMILSQNPYANKKANPLNNAVWSTNFRTDDPRAKKMEGVNVVRNNDRAGVNMVDGKGRRLEGNQAVNVAGPAGTTASGNVPQRGPGGVNVNGPKGTGSANVQTNNGLPTTATVNVMGSDGKVHSVRRDLGQDVGQEVDKLVPPVLSH
jgi:hypothetical protein